ncbi:MAG: Gfo/Idh/MocA family oxidoreductase [Rubellimicrobium sp.]|nr:Gfo/Idh/MocA family oxidoreductase [Rubellimicrobium sp.]
MTDHPPVRMGIVGVGTLTLRAILPHLTQADIADRVTVTAVCDPVLARAEQAAQDYGVPAAHPSLEAMLAADDVDAVTVVSPIGLHYDHCRRALEAGKHVHVNKTMTTTVAEADHLIALARDKGLRIVASPGEILRPQVRAARRLLRDGAIGHIAWAECGVSFGTYHENEPERTAGKTAIDPSWYYRRPGGGPVYDVTSYSLHQLTAILGPAKRVTAMSGIRVPSHMFQGAEVRTEMDDNTFLLIDFGEGTFVFAYGAAAGRSNPQFAAATYHGTKGTLDGILLNGEMIEFEGREDTLDKPVTDWEGQCRTLPHVTGPHRDIPEAHIFEDMMQLVRWIREGVPSLATADHARHVIEIIEAGYAAAAEGRTVALKTSFDLPDDDL